MGLRLFFLPNFPEAAFIQGATFIPDSRVPTKHFKGLTREGKDSCNHKLIHVSETNDPREEYKVKKSSTAI